MQSSHEVVLPMIRPYLQRPSRLHEGGFTNGREVLLHSLARLVRLRLFTLFSLYPREANEFTFILCEYLVASLPPEGIPLVRQVCHAVPTLNLAGVD